MRRPRGEAGNALVEFTYLSVLLMVPVVSLLLAVFQVQRAAFAVTEAARQAGRAYAQAATVDDARFRAETAVSMALRDQGLEGGAALEIDCPGAGSCLDPGTRVEVRVSFRVGILGLGSIPVSATHEQRVDLFGAGP